MSPKKRRQQEYGRRRTEGSATRKGQRGYPVALRLRAAREVVDDGASAMEVSRTLGIGYTTLVEWVRRYRENGAEGLISRPKEGQGRQPARTADPRRRAVTDLRREHPDWGTRRISDVLRRFEALGVPESEVRRILHEEGLIPETQARTPAREHGPRRFERAELNQLWQSDIFTFLLRRHERLYLAGFMDDHSRYLVSYALSGAKPVTEVIAEMKLSRGTYYQLEERAMLAMLRALSPTAGPDGTETAALDEALAKVKELQAKVERMEQEKRRTDRLVYVMNRLVKPGPVVVEGRGRPRKRRGHSGSSVSTGSGSSPGSTRLLTSTNGGAAGTSTPMPAGADGR